VTVGVRTFRVAEWVDRLILLLGILTTAAAIAYLSRVGQYYLLPLWERPDFPFHRTLRPAGDVGHGLGIAGTVLIAIAIATYSGRKRLRVMQGRGPMRTWLNLHIYLCLTGPLLVTFHSTLKLGGLASWSYWSMMIVAGSGIVGRWLYQQFPRTIKGAEMSLDEVRSEQTAARELLSRAHAHAPAALKAADAFAERAVARVRSHGVLTLPWLVLDDLLRPFRLAALHRRLQRIGQLPKAEATAIVSLVKEQVTLARRIAFLGLFRRLFHYWHLTHLVFFVAMVVFLVMHVAAAVFFGLVAVGT
jgi:hypothetical protein